MSILVISTSLNPKSLSRVMAHEIQARIKDLGVETSWLDVRDTPLPMCDADTCYTDHAVVDTADRITKAQGVILATPVYNYSVSASAKNLIEVTGSAWTDKVVGFLCAAGGLSSYMAPMGIANSLMLDFRCIVIPRFVYAKEDSFSGDRIDDAATSARISELAGAVTRITRALHPIPSETGNR